MLTHLKKLFKQGIACFLSKPVYVFHHIPKCGGTSFRTALHQWFNVVNDYRDPQLSQENLKKSAKSISKLRKMHCLVGHWDVEGYHLKDRYPSILLDRERYFMFTFLRDPLEVKISLYFYELAQRKALPYTLEERLMSSPNYIAGRFPCTIENYKDVLNRYNFIGVLERPKESLDKLAGMIKKKKIDIPHLNISGRNPEAANVTEDVIASFKERNKLDYLIYNYALDRLNE